MQIRLALKFATLLSACLLLAYAAPCQTLARPGFAGSGLNTDPWWKHAVIYLLPGDGRSPEENFKSSAARLDMLQSLGVDALLMDAPDLSANADLGSFDELVREAGTRNIRLLLSLKEPGASDINPIARFWLSRGVAGLQLTPTPKTSAPDYQSSIDSLRRVVSGTVGERIVIADALFDSEAGLPDQNGRHAIPRNADSLQINSRLSRLPQPDAASVRTVLTESLTKPNQMLFFPTSGGLADKPMATVLLATHSAALISDPKLANPEPGSQAESLAAWYRRLTALHRGHPTLRHGSFTVLNFDAENAVVWVGRPAVASALAPAVVIACNFSSSPVQLALADAVKAVGLHGSFLRTLARTDQGMGAQNLNSVQVAPYGVYIGELHR